MNAKHKVAAAYDPSIADACEVALVRLMLAFATHKHLLRLVGGLVPRYLTKAQPPEVPQHVGTTDVDVVLNVSVLESEGTNYASLRDQLVGAGFQRLRKPDGSVSSWQWELIVGGKKILVEFLRHTDDPNPPRRVASLHEEQVSACLIPHVGIVEEWYAETEIAVELEDGVRTETIRHADVVSFLVLKALAFESRGERKDAADLIHVLRYWGAPEDVADVFAARMEQGIHSVAVEAALSALARHFCSDETVKGYRKSGPGGCAAFAGLSNDSDAFARECREVSGLVTYFLTRLGERLGRRLLPN